MQNSLISVSPMHNKERALKQCYSYLLLFVPSPGKTFLNVFGPVYHHKFCFSEEKLPGFTHCLGLVVWCCLNLQGYILSFANFSLQMTHSVLILSLGSMKPNSIYCPGKSSFSF